MAVDRRSRGVLDTSTVILLPRLKDATQLPSEPLITAITLAELSVGPLVASTETERAARQAHLQQAEADFEPLPFDVTAARVFGRVAASLRRAGRKSAARAYDAMIAAIAIANDLPVYTCNPADLAGIDGLELVAVPHPDAPLAPRRYAARGCSPAFPEAKSSIWMDRPERQSAGNWLRQPRSCRLRDVRS